MIRLIISIAIMLVTLATYSQKEQNVKSQNITVFVEGVQNPKIFFRVNRKCLIPLNAISDIISYSNSRLQIKIKNFNAFNIIVSREKVKKFKNWIS